MRYPALPKIGERQNRKDCCAPGFEFEALGGVAGLALRGGTPLSGSTMKSRLLRETLIILALFSALIVVSGLITAREVDEELIARRTQNLGDYVAMLEYSMRSFPCLLYTSPSPRD